MILTSEELIGGGKITSPPTFSHPLDWLTFFFFFLINEETVREVVLLTSLLPESALSPVSAGSCTSRASIVNTDHWLSLVLDMRTGPGVALALESLVETNLQTCCPPVALASARRSAKPWPGEMGPPKPGGHPREDRVGPAPRDPFPRPKAAGPPGWFAARPGHRVTQAPPASGLRPLPPRLLVARGDASAGSGRSSLALPGLGPSASRGFGRHEPRRRLRTQASGSDQRRCLRRLFARARGTVAARGPRAAVAPAEVPGRLAYGGESAWRGGPGCANFASGVRG